MSRASRHTKATTEQLGTRYNSISGESEVLVLGDNFKASLVLKCNLEFVGHSKLFVWSRR